MYKIVIIIVNWNGGEKVIRCIDSIYSRLKKVSFLIVVVDNHSEDGSPERIKERYKDITLIENKQNLGFSKANNIGLKVVFDHRIQTDYVFFLNNDAELLDDSMGDLIDFLDNHRDIIALTPCIMETGGRYQTGVGGKRFTLLNIFIYFFFLNRLPLLKAYGINLNQKYFCKKNKIVNLEWISGTAFLARFGLIANQRLLPSNYFMYCEDVVMSETLKKRGRLVFYPFFKIKHYREYGNESIKYYFDSLFFYLKQKGLSSFKLKLVKAIMYTGLYLRYLILKLMGLFDRDKMSRADINKSQIKAIKLINLKSTIKPGKNNR